MRKLLAALAVLSLFTLPSLAFAEDSNFGLDTTAGEALCPDNPESCTGTQENTNLAYFIGARIINPALGLVGVIFFILMIYGGFLWMTARGNPKQVGTAKDVLVAAVIGVVVISAAYAITATLFSELSGASSTSSGELDLSDEE